MVPHDFTLGMRNRLTTGFFDDPSEVSRRNEEWLIVERKGPFLAISEAGILTDAERASPGASVPDAAVRTNTLLATFIEQHPQTKEEIFLFSQFPIETGLTLGTFFPGEGYVRLRVGDAGIELRARGRHFHIAPPVGSPPGTPPVNGGKPGAGDSGAINWHFDALQRPWTGTRIG